MDGAQLEIWNRACMDRGGIHPREGDLALVALLALHGPAMNGGLAHACEFLGRSKCVAAVQGFRFFNLDELALLIERAMRLSEEDAEALDDRYFELLPRDTVLEEAFFRKRAASPESFAPVDRQAS